MRLGYIAIASMGLAVGCGITDSGNTGTTFGGATMGTRYVVRMDRLPTGVTAQKLHTEIAEILDTIDTAMSTYRPDSDISRFNRASSTDWFAVSAETRAVIGEALQVGAMTDGAFDVTVGPLVALWGFGAIPHAPSIPPEPAIRDAMRNVGSPLVEVHSDAPAIRKLKPDVAIDLSAIAKGFAVDRLADHLTARGVNSFLVEIGGELRVRGRAPGGDRWRIAVQEPTGEAGAAEMVMELEDMALATSGDYRNFFMRNGVRYSHVLDPRTGHPVAHDLVSVTVVDASAMRADALATGLLVLGPELGQRLAIRLALPVLFVRNGPAGITRFATPSFENLAAQSREQRRST